MSRRKEQIFIYIISALCFLLNVLSFGAIWFYVLENGEVFSLTYLTNQLIFIVYFICFLYFCGIFDGFAFNRRRVSENVYSLTLSSSLASLIFYFLETLAFRTFDNPLYLISTFIISLLINGFCCIFANRIIFSNYIKKKTIIYYKDDDDLDRVKQLTYFDIKYEIIDVIKNPEISDINYGCDAVFISGIDMTIRNKIVKKCIEQKIDVFIFPSVGDVVVSGGRYVEEFFLPMLRISRINRSAIYLLVKRLLDLILSLIALVVLSPLMIIVAIVIKIYDGGPVLYKQTRYTKGLKLFTIYKFRSMRIDAEKDGVARLVSKNDNRITPIGKFIRAVRIDELPQLINIIKGDMSIVGPRPERPEIVSQYLEKYPSFNLRLQVKAGLTGYAQIYGRYNTEPVDKLKMDLFYINNMSFVFDLKMVFLTIKVLFQKESTESVEEGRITAKK